MNTTKLGVSAVLIAVCTATIAVFSWWGSRMAVSVPVDAVEVSRTTNDSLPNVPVAEYQMLTFSENALDVSGWATYTSKDFGFDVKYPKGWHVEEETVAQLKQKDPGVLYRQSLRGRIVFDSGDPYVSLSVSVYDESLEGVKSYTEQWMTKSSASGLQAHAVVLNNTQGFWYPDEKGEYYDFGNYLFGDVQTAYHINHSVSPKGVNIAETEIYQKIILSFKLLP